jgi:hypothetical protein
VGLLNARFLLFWIDRQVMSGMRLFSAVSQNRYSTALDPFLEFAVHLGVYGKVCLGPPF